MNERLTFVQILLLCGYAIGMAGGQMLFKLASLRFTGEASLGERLLTLAQNGYFVAALAAYFALSVVWVWILSFTPLSRAYPFVALAFAVTPLLGGLVFSEPMPLRLLVGIGVVLCGLVLVAG
jgi:drug/metabolite transporter (DMT)-like permease